MTSKNRYWIVCQDESTGDSENCNPFYSTIVYCKTEQDAKNIGSVVLKYPAKRLYAIKKTLHKIDTYNNRDGDISDFDSEDF